MVELNYPTTIQGTGMSNESSTPPPGLSQSDLHELRYAREALLRADETDARFVKKQYLREVLAAYDVLAARHAWLAAEHATLKMGGRP
jgi:hypothetical protein